MVGKFPVIETEAGYTSDQMAQDTIRADDTEVDWRQKGAVNKV